MTGNEIRLGPDDLIGREFAIGLRGYDRDEVDAFLAQAADAWRASLSAAPPAGLSSSAMAALAEADGPAPITADPFAAPVAPGDAGTRPVIDPFAGPVVSDPFAAPVAPASEPAPFAPASFEPAPFEPASFVPSSFDPAPPVEPAVPDAPVASAVEATQAETERDRTAAYAERAAAELDRAAARTELAKAQEEALHIIDQAQRRAEVVLTGARDKARAEAETVLEDARSRLTPLLEQERAVRARLARLRSELDAIAAESPEVAAPVSLPPAQQIVTATEDDPATPEAPFPVGYGSVTLDH